MKFGKLIPVAALVFPLAGHAVPIGSALQTEANPGGALAGNAESVTVSFEVTRANGLPHEQVEENEVFIESNFNQPTVEDAPSTDCELVVVPDSFVSHGHGIYTVELAPPSPSCGADASDLGPNWEEGEYHYLVRINASGQGGRIKGAALGSFEIQAGP